MKLREFDERAELLAPEALEERGVFVLRRGSEFPRITASTILLRTSEGALVVDPGERRNLSGIETALNARGYAFSDVERVLVTHFHYDHVENLERFDKARILISKIELDLVDRLLVLPKAQLASFILEQGENVKPTYLRLTMDSLAAQESFLDRLAPLRERFDVVDGESEIADGIHLIPTPGHTAGHRSLLLREHGLWIAGDAWPSARFTPDDEDARLPFVWSSVRFRETLNLMLAQAKMIVPGHGPPFSWRSS